MSRYVEIMSIYSGSDGTATGKLYAELEALGPRGSIAMNLIRATKASERAKVYRGGGYRRQAYDKKQWSMDNACRALLEHGADLRWGWGEDAAQPVHRHVLYVDLPTGQISFHSEYRGEGPGYPGEWDGQRGQSADRITRWCAQLLDDSVAALAHANREVPA
jgi:hypothetical protein